jgi:hypothetical protein
LTTHGSFALKLPNSMLEPAVPWNRVAAQISAERGLSFHENVHLFALLNVTMADAVIACWDSKYRYSFWRPITAIQEGLTPADADPTWEPWLDFFPPGTPAFPEYPSAHALAAPRRSSSPPLSETTPPLPLHPNRVPALVRSPVSQAPFQKSPTLASLAASISALPATLATPWVGTWRISSRGTRCALQVTIKTISRFRGFANSRYERGYPRSYRNRKSKGFHGDGRAWLARRRRFQIPGLMFAVESTRLSRRVLCVSDSFYR